MDRITTRRRRPRPAASKEYVPLPVGADAAKKGVRHRLMGAVCANGLVVLSLCLLFALQLESFALLMGIVITASLLLISIGLLLSATAEESMHQLAATLQHQDDPRLLGSEPPQARSPLDGSL